MKNLKLEPWMDETALRWLATLDSWPRLVRLVQTTLKQEPRKFPHQIRAAAALLIMIGREGLWPTSSGILSIEDVSGLARRQLAQVKHLFSTQARLDRGLVKDRGFRTLLNSLDEELRILEARASRDDSPALPQEPPCSWGDFWTKEE